MKPLAPIQYTTSGTASTGTLYIFPPLADGDEVKSLRLIAGSGVEDGGANSLTFSLYACRSRPATAGEAADGRTLINALTIPMQHTLTGADPLVLKLTSFLNAVIPLLLAADQATRFLALVVTTVYSTSLLAALDVERPEGQ